MLYLNNRKFSNLLRLSVEEFLPPVLRDSRLFYLLARLAFGPRAGHFFAFRPNAANLSEQDYSEYYREYFVAEPFSTDINQACLERLYREVEGPTILDVGCGRGFLARELSKWTSLNVTATDLKIRAELRTLVPKASFIESLIDCLPFEDNSFDTVICAHTLEHILDFDNAVKELRRVTRKKLIIIVPKEREYLYSFNMHLQFFPYRHSLINRLRPGTGKYVCEVLDGDIFYVEDLQ